MKNILLTSALALMILFSLAKGPANVSLSQKQAPLSFLENKGQVFITNPITESYELHVYDVTGRLIETQKLINQNTILNISTWAGGLYLLKINDGNGNIGALRLVKE